MLPSVRLVIAGPPTLPDDAQRLRRLVEVENVSNRVTLELRLLPPLRPGATRQRRVWPSPIFLSTRNLTRLLHHGGAPGGQARS